MLPKRGTATKYVVDGAKEQRGHYHPPKQRNYNQESEVAYDEELGAKLNSFSSSPSLLLMGFRTGGQTTELKCSSAVVGGMAG